MSRLISKAESWETAYEAYQQINFTAFDFQSVKDSMIEYIKLYFPENFNDYIESSEFIAILELFAYISELLAYRIDMTSHENFISVAQRKQSVLRLAKLISYNPSRNLPARGLVKITSVTTTESVYDTKSINLSNKKIIWNDANNSSWKEQFLLVLNRALQQSFGTVSPNDRIQIDDVLFELYPLKNEPITNGIISYLTNVSGQQYPMELVPSTLSEKGPEERRPEYNSTFTLLYGSDGLGDGSDTTGFFIFTKQGTLHKQTHTYDGVIPNQTTDISVVNINETDVWVNQINPDTGATIQDSVVDLLKRNLGKQGEWEPVDLENVQNIIFNTNLKRNKYEIETLENDQIRIIFGDGEFADIPNGTFDIWFRTSANEDLVIPRNSISNQTTSFTYVDTSGITQTLTITFSLVNALTNSSASEDIEHVRRIAPSVYYTQDRMVNGRDYNSYMLRDPSILKMRAVNRTFSGDSKYLAWHDPSEHYENVKLFGDDLIVYYAPESTTLTYSDTFSNSVIITNYLQPLLSLPTVWIFHASNGLDIPSREFTQAEKLRISNEMDDSLIVDAFPLKVAYVNTGTTWEWLVYDTNDTVADAYGNTYSNVVYTFLIDHNSPEWELTHRSTKLVIQSDTTNFWFNNEDSVLTYDTQNTNYDQVIILKANPDIVTPANITLPANIPLNVIGQVLNVDGPPDDLGLPNIHKLQVIPQDSDGDGTPDDMTLSTFMNLTDYVYFRRTDGTDDQYEYITLDNVPTDVITNYVDGYVYDGYEWMRYRGRGDINFAWFHRTPRYDLVDPSTTNIHDMFIISSGYYAALKNWIDGTGAKPSLPTPIQLKTDYAELLNSKMLSDTVILHPGKFRILFGDKSESSYQAKFRVIRTSNRSKTDNEIKVQIVSTIKSFFNIDYWEFGETFYFTELAAQIHAELPNDIASIVLVPLHPEEVFGDLFMVSVKEDELLLPDISVDDIEIVTSFNSQNLRQTQ